MCCLSCNKASASCTFCVFLFFVLSFHWCQSILYVKCTSLYFKWHQFQDLKKKKKKSRIKIHDKPCENGTKENRKNSSCWRKEAAGLVVPAECLLSSKVFENFKDCGGTKESERGFVMHSVNELKEQRSAT